MPWTRVRDLNGWRADFELGVIALATIGFTAAAAFLYVAVDAYRVTGRLSFAGQLTLPATACMTAGLWGVFAYVRTRKILRTLAFDPVGRAYEVRQGFFDRRVSVTGGFTDFASVRLETTVRLVSRRYTRYVEFWTVSVHWKDAALAPFCLQEFEGRVVTPPPFGPRPYTGGEHNQAQAALRRWADLFAVSPCDTTIRTR